MNDISAGGATGGRLSLRERAGLASARVASVLGLFVYAAGAAILAGGLAPAGRGIGLSETQTGLILGIGALFGIVMAPLWGYASERVSRRRLILAAMPMVALAPAAMALVLGSAAALPVTAVFLLLGAARLVQAAFGAALLPVTQGYLADHSARDRRIGAMGFLGAFFSLGTVSGSLLLWATSRHGPGLSLTILACFGFAALLFAMFRLPEIPRRPGVSPAESAVPWRTIWPNFAITIAGFAAYTMVQPVIGLRLMDKAGLDAASAAGAAGMAIGLAALCVLLSQSLVALRPGRSAGTMLAAGSAGALAGLVALSAAVEVWQVALSMIAVGLSLGFVVPANLAAISLAAGDGAQGKVGGINAAARGVGISIGPILGMAAYGHGPDTPVIIAAALVGLVTALAIHASANFVPKTEAGPAPRE